MNLQDKIDQMTWDGKRPTDVRLELSMLEDFKKRVMISQIKNPA
jgi:hypothetical protein